MPESKFFGQTVIVPPGKPRLVQLSHLPITLIIQTPVLGSVAVVRHWCEEKKATELCRCSPPCATSRNDTFVSVLEWIGPLTWEQHLWAMTDSALAQIWRLLQTKNLGRDFKGVGVGVRRCGDRHNGRVLCEWLHFNSGVPTGFDVHHAVLSLTGIATEFFGQPDTEPVVPNADQVTPPARSRKDLSPAGSKPRIPLGRRQG